jgi:sialic acid synthase SpsE
MVDSIRIIEKALGDSDYRLTDKQTSERKLTRSLFVSKDVKAGDFVSDDNIRSVRPHAGLHTKYYSDVIGKAFKEDVKKGEPLSFDMLNM